MTTQAWPERALSAMTPRQADVFENVLAIGTERPYAPVGIVDEVRATVHHGVAGALHRWPEPSLWVSKSAVLSVRRCEAGFVASRAQQPPAGKHAAAAVGDLAHRAIQLAYTHPNHPVSRYVQEAAGACTAADPAFAALWEASDMAAQSDMLMAATSRVTAFLDSWPALRAAWEPRFEEPVQAKVGKVTLSARLDLVLGRPRPSGQQSMVVADWKSGGLHDHHSDEAAFHALVCTLSFGVPPFRSLVYSLSSGEYSDPAVTPGVLRAAAQQVVEAVTSMVDLLTERRSPRVLCGQPWCAPCSTAPAVSAAA